MILAFLLVVGEVLITIYYYFSLCHKLSFDHLIAIFQQHPDITNAASSALHRAGNLHSFSWA